MISIESSRVLEHRHVFQHRPEVGILEPGSVRQGLRHHPGGEGEGGRRARPTFHLLDKVLKRVVDMSLFVNDGPSAHSESLECVLEYDGHPSCS